MTSRDVDTMSRDTMTRMDDADTGQRADDARREFSLRLDDQLCFALYAASRAVTGIYRPLLDRLGLTYPQYLVMLVLWEYNSSSVKELCAALHLDYGTLSPLLKRLESTGLLRRERRADDERSVQVTLTDRGAALREQASELPEIIATAVGLSEEEIAALRATLRRLTTTIGITSGQG